MEDYSNSDTKRICRGLSSSNNVSDHTTCESDEVRWLKNQLQEKDALLRQAQEDLRQKESTSKQLQVHSRQDHGQVTDLNASGKSRGTRFNTPSDQNMAEGYELMLHTIYTWTFDTTNDLAKQLTVKSDTPNHSWLTSHMSRLSPTEENKVYSRNKVYLQHSLACLIAHTVIDSLCDDNTFMRDSRMANRPLAEAEELLYRPGHHAEYQRWLGHTRSLVEKAEPGLLEQINNERADHLTKELKRAIRAATNITNADVDWSTLSQIVRPAVVFFTKTYYHPAKFAFKPESTSTTGLEDNGYVAFDPSSYTDISGDHEPCDGFWIVGIVYPGLQKIRDENGEKVINTLRSHGTILTLIDPVQIPGITKGAHRLSMALADLHWEQPLETQGRKIIQLGDSVCLACWT